MASRASNASRPPDSDDVVGILAGRELDEAQGAVGADVGEGAKRGADRGLAAGVVAVEAQDRRGVEAPHPLELRLGDRGAVGRDGLGDAGAVEGDHVHIAFDHDQPLGGAARGAGAVDVVERAALVEERRVGGVEVFGLALAEDAAAEGDDPAARVADRDHQPAAEAVVAVLARLLGLDEHAGLDELVLAELFEGALEGVAAVGRETDAEAGDRRLVDAAALEIFAGVGAGDALQLLGIPFGDFAP